MTKRSWLRTNRNGSLAIIAAIVIILLLIAGGAAYYYLMYAPAADEKQQQQTYLPGVNDNNTIAYVMPLCSVYELYTGDHDYQGVYHIVNQTGTVFYSVSVPESPGDIPAGSVSPNGFSVSGAHDLFLWIGIQGPAHVNASKSFTFSGSDVSAGAGHALAIHAGYFAVSESGTYAILMVLFAKNPISGAWVQQGAEIEKTLTVAP